MKKIVCLSIATLVLLASTACGGTENEGSVPLTNSGISSDLEGLSSEPVVSSDIESSEPPEDVSSEPPASEPQSLIPNQSPTLDVNTANFEGDVLSTDENSLVLEKLMSQDNEGYGEGEMIVGGNSSNSQAVQLTEDTAYYTCYVNKQTDETSFEPATKQKIVAGTFVSCWGNHENDAFYADAVAVWKII